MAFSELVSKFEKIRDYMRDFYVYGFKTREQFSQKSLRTYDNEKRRIESYLGQYIRWNYSAQGKRAFISVDSARLPQNPLYAAWKAKTFVTSDIILHFYLLDALRTTPAQSISMLTDTICAQSGVVFDLQTVRNKCNHYVALGLLSAQKQGRSLVYSLYNTELTSLCHNAGRLAEAITFFQGTAPFGVVGSYLMDQQGLQNNHYYYKHKYFIDTLEDGILLDILAAIRQQTWITFENTSRRSGQVITATVLPLQILTNTGSGRRYVCTINRYGKYRVFRLDSIRKVVAGATEPDYCNMKEQFRVYYRHTWAIAVAQSLSLETVCMKLHIAMPGEAYVLRRLEREGHGGQVECIAPNTYLYTVMVQDANELSPWVKTFLGRILQFECDNEQVYHKFYRDIKALLAMYREEPHNAV